MPTQTNRYRAGNLLRALRRPFTHAVRGKRAFPCVVGVCAAALVGFSFTAAPLAGAAEKKDGSLRTARQIVRAMTLDEKIAQMHGVRTEQLYRVVPGLPRLGIPALRITNGPAGVGPGGAGMQLRATALPSPVALAASWDVNLAQEYGVVAGKESKALGFDLLEAPAVNIVRVPQSGRSFETFGEDPFLTSRIAVASILGIQSTGVLANIKHYLANNQETDRGSINELIEERTLREIYMPAFEAAVKEARVASVMCAYPKVNGTFNCENKPLQKDTLKNDWNFDGFVTSDFGAVHSTVPSIEAGLDLELPTGEYYSTKLKQAVEAGRVPVSAIDEALVRRFSKMIAFGLFAPQQRTAPVPILQHGETARKIAEQSTVLLKNSGKLLPLDYRKVKSVALIGPYAVRPMSGGGGSSHVIPLYTVQPGDGISAHVLSQSPVDVLDGRDLGEALAAAKKRDIAILMIGDDEGEDHDHSIDLPRWQNELVEAVAAANPRTIVVLKSGAAVTMPWIDHVPAVLEAWYPGQEDGNAVARVLFGDVNPSGKLPVTFPRREKDTLAGNSEQYPGNHAVVHYSEGLLVGYRWFQERQLQPLFPFGFGLSYTTFSYTNLKIRQTPGKPDITVTFQLTNAGRRAGAEVAQVYVHYPHIPEGDEPPQQLKGFEKVYLEPGASKELQITLDRRAFSYWSARTHNWEIAPGAYEISVGPSSEERPLKARVSIQ